MCSKIDVGLLSCIGGIGPGEYFPVGLRVGFPPKVDVSVSTSSRRADMENVAEELRGVFVRLGGGTSSPFGRLQIGPCALGVCVGVVGDPGWFARGGAIAMSGSTAERVSCGVTFLIVVMPDGGWGRGRWRSDIAWARCGLSSCSGWVVSR